MNLPPSKIDKRRAGSEETRRLLLDNARALLASGDFARFSLESVARRAGVSRLTIYYQFGSKRGLLEALYDDLAARGNLLDLPRVFTESDPARALTRFVGAFCHFWASDTDLIRRLRAIASLNPDFASAVQRDEWRRNGLKALIARVAAGRPVSSPVPPDRLADILSALTGFETFDSLKRAGWSEKEITDSVTHLVLQLLCVLDASDAGPSTS